MKSWILVIALALSAVVVSSNYSIKDENNMSELVEANIEALSQETQNVQPCIRREKYTCMEWVVISNGPSGVVNYPDYINYMEVEVDE